MTSPFRLIKALHRQPVDSTPLWFMRQAGRYLPEYRLLREQAGGFLAMCKTPEIACEITLQPLRRFDLDAAIIFSDILTIPDAMGLGLYFAANEGPQFERPVRTQADVDQLPTLDPNTELGYVMDAIRLVNAAQSKVPVIGFCGSPWTVATYMVEGKGSRTFSEIKTMMYQAPQVLLNLLNKLTHASNLYLSAQVAAGAKALMIFDTWGGVLSTEQFGQFSLYFLKEMIAFLKIHHPHIPVIVFTKQGGQWLESLADTGCHGLGIDWTVDLKTAKKRVGDRVALQGNLDPAILYAPDQLIRSEVQRTLAAFGAGSGHIFNLGHGIAPDMSFEKLQVMIDAVREFSPQYHNKESAHESV
jgi:uroporphyrinogen decarboxylase